MTKKFLTLSFGLVLVFALALSVGAGEKGEPTPLPDGLPSFERSDEQMRGPCYWLSYYNGFAYYWQAPQPTYGDISYAQRFTVCGPETLQYVDIYIHDPGDGTFGNDDVYCTIYDDDDTPAHLPGALITQVMIPAGGYVNGWNSFNFMTGAPLIVGCNFHVAFSSSAAVGSGEYECCLSDDGTHGKLRSSSEWTPGYWVDMLSGWGTDVNFVFEVYLCPRDDVGADHKMHFPQYPDLDGWDVNATWPIVLADDWQCSETGWIKDIHFWGSWRYGETGIIDSFLLSIHSDIPDPDGDGPLYSMPGDLLWDRIVNDFATIPIDSGIWQGWYYSSYGDYWYDDHDHFFQYNVCLDSLDWFWQDNGTIYWLNISAFVEDTVLHHWGWKSTEDHWNDDAVWSWEGYSWVDIFEPGTSYLLGDVDGDGITLAVADLVYLVNYVAGGPAPPFVIPGTSFHPTADCNGNCVEPEQPDADWYAAYFQGGPPPTYCPQYPPRGVSLDLSFVITGGPCGDDPPPDPPPGKAKHNINGFNVEDGDPIGSMWHELWPTYCKLLELTSWQDNGDGILSYCDVIDFTIVETGQKIWEHVEWVGPTITVVDQYPPYDTYYLDYVQTIPDFKLDPITDPVGTWWHEVYPVHCQMWKITWWEDNGNGYLDSCDFIGVIRDGGTQEEMWHVEAIETDIITTPLPIPDADEYDHNLDGYLPDMGDPTGTMWHELYPNYCDIWVLDEFIDNGDGVLSYCDTIKFRSIEYPDSIIWKHVEDVTPTIWYFDGVDTMYFDYLCGNPWIEPIVDPVGLYWHEIVPDFCTRWVCIGWVDNGSGYLDFCDLLLLEAIDGPDSGQVIEIHVDGIATDIVTTIISQEECDCVPGEVNLTPPIDLLDILYLIQYKYTGGPGPLPYDTCSGDVNCDCIVNLMDILYLIQYKYKDGTAPCSCEDWVAACGWPLRE